MMEFKAKKNPLREREEQLGTEVAWADKADSSQTARQALSGKEECVGGERETTKHCNQEL